MIINKKNFWSWQGNESDATTWTNYLFFAIGVIVVIGLFMAKRKLREIGSRDGKRWIFKNEGWMWRTIGIIGTLVTLTRLTLMWVYGYPLYWEGLGLHLCRALLLIMFLMLSFNKIKYIKYLIFLAIVGFIAGILLTWESSDAINNAYDSNGNYLYKGSVTYDNFYAEIRGDGGKVLNLAHYERLMLADGFKYYHAGWDNFFSYDVYLAHLSLLIIPTYIYISRNQKLSVKQFHVMQITYIGITTLMWLLNIALSYAPDMHWRSNFWYNGKDEYNNMSNLMGPLLKWPVNYIFYVVVGIIMTQGWFLLMSVMDKLEFFKDKKFITKVKSKKWVVLKKEYKELFSKIRIKK